MIQFDSFQLPNGLKVLVHKDTSTLLAAVNILYDVGAKDEHPNKTGFAHLFEHLMFGGSVNIPEYDAPLEKAGGENNAFTSNDITNYYITLPVNNLETAFWLESDRMLGLAFSKKSLEVQRNVVIEEYKQRLLNQPYEDAWLMLRPLAYKEHPYQWDTIGKDISHIENATMKDVKAFFNKHYCPANAIMVVAGNVETSYVRELVEKWFDKIERKEVSPRNLPKEPKQTEERKQTIERVVPYDAIYKAYHMCKRGDNDFYAMDMIADLLSRGNSSRLYQNLVKENKLFSEIDAFASGDLDEGLFVIEGKLVKGVSLEVADKAIVQEIEKIKKENVSETELQKVKNNIEAGLVFSKMNVLNKAMNLAFYELLGNAELINNEEEIYLSVTTDIIKENANRYFDISNCSTLYYKSIE